MREQRHAADIIEIFRVIAADLNPAPDLRRPPDHLISINLVSDNLTCANPFFRTGL